MSVCLWFSDISDVSVPVSVPVFVPVSVAGRCRYLQLSTMVRTRVVIHSYASLLLFNSSAVCLAPRSLAALLSPGGYTVGL